MTDKQVGGDHYRRLKVQPWDAMEAAFPESFPDHLLMCAMKYIMRDKDDKYIDIQKAAHYLEKWLTISGVQPVDASQMSSFQLNQAYPVTPEESDQYQVLETILGIRTQPEQQTEAAVQTQPRKRGRPRKSSQQPVAILKRR